MVLLTVTFIFEAAEDRRPTSPGMTMSTVAEAARDGLAFANQSVITKPLKFNSLRRMFPRTEDSQEYRWFT